MESVLGGVAPAFRPLACPCFPLRPQALLPPGRLPGAPARSALLPVLVFLGLICLSLVTVSTRGHLWVCTAERGRCAVGSRWLSGGCTNTVVPRVPRVAVHRVSTHSCSLEADDPPSDVRPEVKSSRTVRHTLTAFTAFLSPCGHPVGQHHKKKKGEYCPVVYGETNLPVTQTPPPAGPSPQGAYI